MHFDSARKRPASHGRPPDDPARAMAFYGEAFGIMQFDASAA